MEKPVTMRTPFPSHQISKLPKPTKAQTDKVKENYTNGVRCKLCGGWHHPDVVHLDYVGHAALTDRLLDVDPNWTWEPVAMDSNGLPAIDKEGGLWIRLTVCGVTRLGYGDAQGKTGGDAMKERIGDALRNAAMRFGAALDLWHKGDLHIDYDDDGKPAKQVEQKDTVQQSTKKRISIDQVIEIEDAAKEHNVQITDILFTAKVDSLEKIPADWFDNLMEWIRKGGKK